MKLYVLGFAFDRQGENLLLVEKQRPEWQRGFLNGVGGKIEDFDPTPHHAMSREFLEEAGCDAHFTEWKFVTRIFSDDYEVYVFSSLFENFDPWEFHNKFTDTDEILKAVKVVDVFDAVKSKKMISNLGWLIGMCLDDQMPPDSYKVDFTPPV